MSFVPVLPVGGYGGWAILKRTKAAQLAAFAASPALRREADHARATLASVPSAEALVSDRRLLGVALGAFGLEADIDARAFVRKVLESPTSDPRALANRPEFLVCDEPTSALDVSVQAQVLNIMKDLQRQQGLTYLFISHNLAVVRHVSDQVGVMYLGRLVELADKQTLFSQPRHPYTRMLLDAIPKMHATGQARTPVQGEVPNPLNPPPGCAFNPRCPHANDRCRNERPTLQTIGGVRIACHAVEEGRI